MLQQYGVISGIYFYFWKYKRKEQDNFKSGLHDRNVEWENSGGKAKTNKQTKQEAIEKRKTWHWISDIPLNCQILCQYIMFWVLAKTVCIWRRAFFFLLFSWGFPHGSLTSLQRYSRVSLRVSGQMRIQRMATFQKGIRCLRATMLLRTFLKPERKFREIGNNLVHENITKLLSNVILCLAALFLQHHYSNMWTSQYFT